MKKTPLREHELLYKVIKSGRSLVNSKEATAILGYKENTLRVWASRGCGDLTPVRMSDGAKWRVSEICELIGV